jgi:hypothetical protein
LTGDIVRAVVRELEPRFAAIEARLDKCASRDDMRDFATRDDFRNFATKDDLRNFATKDDLRDLMVAMTSESSKLRVEMANGFGTLRSDMAAQRAEMMKWMFIFWAGQAFAVLAYFRAGQHLAGS